MTKGNACMHSDQHTIYDNEDSDGASDEDEINEMNTNGNTLQYKIYK